MHIIPKVIEKVVNNIEYLKRRLIKSKYFSEFFEFGILSVLLEPQIKHIYGSKKIDYDNDELIVICILLNGELYIKSFMEHYCSMGVKHFVFLDNGSTDRTIEMLKNYENVTILQSKAPYSIYENTMKRYLVEHFSKGKWNLFSDIDELFEYPCADKLDLKGFLQYLNHHSYNVVVAQMLDMFSDTPLGDISSSTEDSLKDKYKYYDISDIHKSDYPFAKPIPKHIKMHSGGIRSRLFGTNNGLTKAALVKMEPNVKTFVWWHHTRNGRLADVSCVLKHYPFNSSYFLKVKEAVQTGRYSTPDEYLSYWEVLKSNSNLNLKFETASLFSGLEKLVDQGFIIVSAQYSEWVNKEEYLSQKRTIESSSD
jgi:hypothetical protein